MSTTGSVLGTALSVFGWALLILSAFGSTYTVAAAIVFRRFFKEPASIVRRPDAVTLLKPLYGAEPCLESNLASFLAQEHSGPIQLVCGVERGDDPAIEAIKSLRQSWTDTVISLVISPACHGASGKISNLINMDEQAAHPILLLSDSDIVATPDYLSRVLAALDSPGVGAVTVLYRGRSDAGFWSLLGAAGLSYQFLPGAVFGVALGLAQPCMGSTIALTRPTLDRIGGFARFADILADDYAIGEEIRALGLRVAVPPLLVTHASAESSFAELWRHEVRWGATVRDIVPAAYTVSVIGMPLPLAILGTLLLPAHAVAGISLLLIALASRVLLADVVDEEAGTQTASSWLLPLRDCLTFAVFVATFFVRSVDWRGKRLRMIASGRIMARTGNDKEVIA